MIEALANRDVCDRVSSAIGGETIFTKPYAWALLLAVIPLAIEAAAAPNPTSEQESRVPSPSLNPADVIRIQVEALCTNSMLDDGMKFTYGFASPENKRSTGPLGRFVTMIRSAPCERLLNHRSARYGPMPVSETKAFRTVTVIDKEGEEIRYLRCPPGKCEARGG